MTETKAKTGTGTETGTGTDSAKRTFSVPENIQPAKLLDLHDLE